MSSQTRVARTLTAKEVALRATGPLLRLDGTLLRPVISSIWWIFIGNTVTALGASVMLVAQQGVPAAEASQVLSVSAQSALYLILLAPKAEALTQPRRAMICGAAEPMSGAVS
jgi:hypothetical protein